MSALQPAPGQELVQAFEQVRVKQAPARQPLRKMPERRQEWTAG